MQLEDVSRGKADLDEKNLRWTIMLTMATMTMTMMMNRTIMPNIENLRLGREKADLGSHLQEMEEELQVWLLEKS